MMYTPYMKEKNLIAIGDRFHSLTVIGRLGSRSGKSLWACLCDCGNQSEVLSIGLTAGTTKSCGCLVGRKRISIGQVFGRLTVLERLGSDGTKTVYRCSCECGNTSEHTSANLNKGITQSCGCLCKEKVSAAKWKHGHGHPNRRSRTYSSWTAMRERCLNPKNKRYPDWGGRGITICERWNDFALFLQDMSEKPDGTSLDRIDNDAGYSPSNCRWSTPKEQANNRRNRKAKTT